MAPSSVTFNFGGQSATVSILASLASGGGGPQLPDVPPGIEIDAADLIGRASVDPVGTVYRVRPGNASGNIKLKAGQQAWGLNGYDPRPGMMPKFTGPNDWQNTMRWLQGVGGEASPTPDVVVAYMEYEKYHVSNPTWVNLSGVQTSNRRLPALWMHTFRNSQFYGLWAHDNGTHTSMGDGCLLQGGLLEWSGHMYLHVSRGTPVNGWQIIGVEARHNNKRRSDGLPVFDKGWERGVKVVKATNYLVEDLYSHDNNGAGYWNDNNENFNGVLRRLNCRNNLDQGIHHEISGTVLIEDSTSLDNSNPNATYISNSAGTAANPIIVRGGEHTAIKIKDNPTRSPRAAHIRIEDAVANSIEFFGNGTLNMPSSIVAINCRNFQGQPIGIQVKT